MPTAVDSIKSRESTALTPHIPEYWHLLSLDAPTVSALWAWFFARAMHIDLPWHAPLLLALGTWLVYVADRILDGSRNSTQLRERHRFHTRHRKTFLIAALAAAVLLIWLIAARMAPNARFEDTVLFFAALLYLVAVHKPRANSANWLPKELIVGIVFAAATAVPAWSRLTGAHHQDGRATLAPAVAIFAALCWLNCVAIERWENLPTTSLNSSNTHITTRWIAEHFGAASLTLATIAGILAALAFGASQSTPPIYLAALSAALLLAIIDQQREHLATLHLRIAADAALLTPVLFIPLLR